MATVHGWSDSGGDVETMGWPDTLQLATDGIMSCTMSETSRSLLERLRTQPDDAAWARLVDVYTPMIRYWLGTQGLACADADDLTQEILMVVVRELPRFRHSGRAGAFRNWLRTIGVHRVRDFRRARRSGPLQAHDAELEALEDPSSLESQRWDQEHDRFVAKRLLELIEPEFSPLTWTAFRRQFFDGQKAAEIAAELKVSTNSVLVAKSRVLRRLRQESAGLID
jgi:RNA polymerase sigma-70 factor (ECF subfamily)